MFERRYRPLPVAPNATNDASLEDFARLFAPGGSLDGFFNTQLKPFVDMSGKQWRLQPVDGNAAPVTPADLAQFQRAATIRDIFFPRGVSTVQLRFEITPAPSSSSAATLDLGGTIIASTSEPATPTQITWPGPARMQAVKLTFDPPLSSGAATLQESGRWALFRLFGRGRTQPDGSSGRSTITFQSGDRQAVFEMRVSGPANPFAPATLQDFRCPAVR